MLGGVSWWFGTPPPQPEKVDLASIAAEASQWTKLETDFASELVHAIGELGTNTGTSQFLQGGDDVWYRELETVRRELNDIESTTGQTHE